jgi:hypothetical protein
LPFYPIYPAFSSSSFLASHQKKPIGSKLGVCLPFTSISQEQKRGRLSLPLCPALLLWVWPIHLAIASCPIFKLGENQAISFIPSQPPSFPNTKISPFPFDNIGLGTIPQMNSYFNHRI